MLFPGVRLGARSRSLGSINTSSSCASSAICRFFLLFASLLAASHACHMISLYAGACPSGEDLWRLTFRFANSRIPYILVISSPSSHWHFPGLFRACQWPPPRCHWFVDGRDDRCFVVDVGCVLTVSFSSTVFVSLFLLHRPSSRLRLRVFPVVALSVFVCSRGVALGVHSVGLRFLPDFLPLMLRCGRFALLRQVQADVILLSTESFHVIFVQRNVCLALSSIRSVELLDLFDLFECATIRLYVALSRCTSAVSSELS